MGRQWGGQQKCLCIQSVSSSICCLGSTKPRRKKRRSAVQSKEQCREQKQRQDCLGHSSYSAAVHKGAKLLSSPPFNLGLRAAHIRADPPHLPSQCPHLLITSLLLGRCHKFSSFQPFSIQLVRPNNTAASSVSQHLF